jgi:hypothetical protein
MRSLCLLALVALLGIATPAYGSDLELSKMPWFCHGLDCPKYTVLETTDAYEARQYEAGVWATTKVDTYNYAMASSIGFRRLFDYIGGSNKDEVKIPMTAPVLADVVPSQGPFCKQEFSISFFVPFHFQDSPPKPNNPDVTITYTPAQTFYVSEAGGFKLDDYSLGKMASALGDALEADGIEFEDDHWYVAGYDPPFRIKDRHTEIWFKAKNDDGIIAAAVAQE